MEFVKSRSDKIVLRKMFVFFYQNEKEDIYPFFLQCRKHFCEYDIYRIKIFIYCIRSKLLFDVFDGCLLDYILPKVRVKTHRCFNHLEAHDCFRFYPYQDKSSRALLSLVDFYRKYNFNLYQPFRLLEIKEMSTRYGKSFTVKFCIDEVSYKTWLPKSAFRVILNCLDKSPLGFNFYDKCVYFRVVKFDSYKGHSYAKIEVQQGVDLTFSLLD